MALTLGMDANAWADAGGGNDEGASEVPPGAKPPERQCQCQPEWQHCQHCQWQAAALFAAVHFLWQSLSSGSATVAA